MFPQKMTWPKETSDPPVLARKVSFGSQSDAGAHTRGVLMTVVGSLKKRGVDVATQLKQVLDELAKNIHQDPFPLLFPRDPPNPKPSNHTQLLDWYCCSLWGKPYLFLLINDNHPSLNGYPPVNFSS